MLKDAGIETSSSVTVCDGDVLVSEVKRGDEVERFLGIAHEDAIIWYSSDIDQAYDYRVKDSFASLDGEQVLRTQGFDLRHSDVSGVGVIYEGELIRD